MNSQNSLRIPATTISFLPDDVLLEVFDLFRIDEATTRFLPWKWHRLAHVCRTWRDIILASSCRLNLELLCTYGTPAKKTLRHLPPLPIAIYFPGSFREVNNEDNANIIAALEHPDRIRSVTLYMSCSSLGNVVTVMQRPFPVLTYLGLKSEDVHTLVIPDSFLGGCAPRLQKIDLDGVPFPAAPKLLSSACNLVDIKFYNIPATGYISPEAMATSLAALSRLEHLTFFKLRWKPWPDQRWQPPITRMVLPALITFVFDGFFEYLEDFVAQIDAPQLGWSLIKYLDSAALDFNLQIYHLCGFIGRSEKLKFRRVDLEFQPGTRIELDGVGSSLELSIQFNGITGLLRRIFGTPSNVVSLFFRSSGYEEVGLDDDIEWSEILRLFTAVKVLRALDHTSRSIALTLGRLVEEEETAGVLPALELLCLEKQPATSVERFVAARRNVGRPVTFVNKSEYLDLINKK